MVTNGLQNIYKFVTRHVRKKPIRCLSWNTHYCGTPTVADDVTLISNDPCELQSMLDIQTSHSNSKRYLISEQKSSILTFNCTKEHKWYLNNKEMSATNKVTHLDIERISTGNNRKELVQTRITTARKTVFALMGAGLHGLNGVNPKVAIHLIQIYVMPRLLYGLEITSLRQNEMQKLESYLKKLLKQVQNLPERTANEATYLMMGRITVIGELHKRILKTFGNSIRKDNSIEKDIALRQLALKGQNSDSWSQALVSFKNYMPPPLPYFKVNIYPFPLPHFASIFFAYL
jgi:5'-3' exonuclease